MRVMVGMRWESMVDAGLRVGGWCYEGLGSFVSGLAAVTLGVQG